MADPRFYDRLGPLSIEEIAALSGAAISDSADRGLAIDDVAPVAQARRGTLCYAEGPKALEGLPTDALAGVGVLVKTDLTATITQLGGVALEHAAPRSAFAIAAGHLLRPRALDPGAAVHASASLGKGVRLLPGCTIGADVEIGDDVIIGANAVIAPGCRIGARSRIGAGASIACANIGEDCNILAGAVIGEAGFGVAVSASGLVDIPHLGTVELADRVTIGANSCVDRGLLGATRIGEGSKIDNLCHIGHNCQVGRNVVMAAYAGVSGSCVIEDNVMFGGRVGLHDHVTIGRGAKIGGNSAVAHNVPPGETWQGDPAQPIRQHMRQVAELRRLVKSKSNEKKD